MNDRQRALYSEAQKRYPNMQPCSNLPWDECFMENPKTGELVLLWNDETNNTLSFTERMAYAAKGK